MSIGSSAKLFGMAVPQRPSIRSLARSLGLAPATVCSALRGTGRVAARTARRVHRAAEAAGYRPDPLTSTVLGELRRGKRTQFRGTLAAIDFHEQAHWPHGPFHTEWVWGARQRAEEMGFGLEDFLVGTADMPLTRMGSILHSRGIHGVIILPSWGEPDLSGLDWSQYAAIYADHVTIEPALHSICPDHYGSMVSLMERLARRGYRRPGLVLELGRDSRVRSRQSAAFRAFAEGRPLEASVPVLLTPGIPQREDFEPWFEAHEPDVVLCHRPETWDWIQDARQHRQRTAGFVLLNVVGARRPCAALDLQPWLLGRRGAELLIGQLLRNELGPPACPMRTLIEAQWVEGPSVRSELNGRPPSNEVISLLADHGPVRSGR